MRRLTTEEFIKKSKRVFGKNTFGYDEVVYINNDTDIKLFCNKHKGYFNQTPHDNLAGNGCFKCNGKHIYTLEEFIQKARKIHGNRYGYDRSVYKNSQTKIEIYCFEHKEYFWQKPNKHLNGHGCSKCSGKLKSNLEEFIKKAKLVHGDRFLYDKFIYNGATTKGLIGCPIKDHGYFLQTPNFHLNGGGCFKCSRSSQGNVIIENWLKENDIKYISEYKFKYCRDILPLPFDFYLSELDVCIEYDGRQHFCFSGFGAKNLQKAYEDIKFHDSIKTEYCLNNHINLIRIPYWDFDNIEQILNCQILLDKDTVLY